MYCIDDGDGEPLLFVHGWTCDSTDFLAQIAHFRRTHRVIAPDLRGHGRSPVVPDPEGYDARTFARDLVGLLDDLDVERCVAIGHSLGAVIASVMAVEHSQRVHAIVCLDPAYGVDGDAAAACQAIVDLMDEPDWTADLARQFADWERASTPAYFRELHVRRMLAMEPMVVRETFRRLFTGDDALGGRARSERYLARRRCPVLSIHAGDHDDRVAWETRLSAHPASRFLHLPLGHWVQHDAPDLINQLIQHWLGTIAAPARHAGLMQGA